MAGHGKSRLAIWALWALLCSAWPQAALADEGDDWSEEAGDWQDDGFAEVALSLTPTTAAKEVVPSPWVATGFARSDQALWVERFDDNPFAKARQSVDLKLDYKSGIWRGTVSTHVDRDLAYGYRSADYDAPTVAAYESLFQLRDAFAAVTLGEFEVTVGRQIVAWGEGDAISPLDVVNPRDMREPGLSDLDDIRIPVLASRVGWFRGAHRIEAMVVHEASFGLRGPPRGPFSPLPWLIHNSPALDAYQQMLPQIPIAERFDAIPLDWQDEQGTWGVQLQQFFLRWVYKGEGIDLGLHVASVLDQQGAMVMSADQEAVMLKGIVGGDPQPLSLTLDHRRYEALGLSGATSHSDFLLKWELVYNHRHPYNGGDFPKVEVVRSDVLAGMVGLTWRGIDDTTLAIEGSKSYLFDRPDVLLFPVDAPIMMLRGMHQAMREDLTLLLAVSAIGWQAEYGWLARAEASYKLAQALKLSLGYITYQPTDEFGPFAGLKSHDRLFARLRWDFAIEPDPGIAAARSR